MFLAVGRIEFSTYGEEFLLLKRLDDNLPFCVLSGCSSVVERHVANVNVVSSNLITR
jgi:hypothetical protein